MEVSHTIGQLKYGVWIREGREAPVIEPMAKTISLGRRAVPRIHSAPKSAVKNLKQSPFFSYRNFIIFIYDYRIFNIYRMGMR